MTTNEKIFIRGNGQKVSYKEMIKIIAKYINDSPNSVYDITIGTDSQSHKKCHMIEVIAIHRISDGGIFFYYEEM